MGGDNSLGMSMKHIVVLLWLVAVAVAKDDKVHSIDNDTNDPDLGDAATTGENWGFGGLKTFGSFSVVRPRFEELRRNLAETLESAPTASPTPSCVHHPGLAPQSWYEQFRSGTLPARLKNISYNGRQVDCSPASCDNPPECGIPACTAIRQYPKSDDYSKSVKSSQCPPDNCEVHATVVRNTEPAETNDWFGFMMVHPATRFGTTIQYGYTPGFVQYYPKHGYGDIHGNSGSWLWANAGNCNPDKLRTYTKNAVAHVGLLPQTDKMHRRAVAVFTKTTWCIDTVCYTYKSGRCYRLNSATVMPEYASSLTKTESRNALKELIAGRYDDKCSPEAIAAATDTIAAN